MSIKYIHSFIRLAHNRHVPIGGQGNAGNVPEESYLRFFSEADDFWALFKGRSRKWRVAGRRWSYGPRCMLGVWICWIDYGMEGELAFW